jgi:hypothetical protein
VISHTVTHLSVSAGNFVPAGWDTHRIPYPRSGELDPSPLCFSAGDWQCAIPKFLDHEGRAKLSDMGYTMPLEWDNALTLFLLLFLRFLPGYLEM